MSLYGIRLLYSATHWEIRIVTLRVIPPKLLNYLAQSFEESQLACIPVARHHFFLLSLLLLSIAHVLALSIYASVLKAV